MIRFILYLLAAAEVAFATSDAFNCKDGTNLTKLAILPGHGWDNLRNIEMLEVLAIDFSDCKRSLDELYLIPNDVQIIPKLASQMETFSEVIENYENYRSLTSKSINVRAHGSFFGASASGSFSWEHQTIRKQQINTGSVTSRVQLRQNMFAVLAGQGMKLHHTFRDRLLDIAFQIKSNATDVAAYIADDLVLHYGTHVVTRVDAGGLIWMIDAIETLHKKLTNSERTTISASASASFGSIFGVSTTYNQTTEHTDVKGYEKNLTARQLGSYGGDPVRPGENITQWSKSLPRNLVAIDVDGDPLYSVVNNLYLGESLPFELIQNVQNSVKGAVERYYKANAIVGCMKPESLNFEPKANIPSSDCEIEKSNFTMGGFFQRCNGNGGLCNGHVVDNIMTGSTECPPGYQEVLLQTRQFATSRHCSGNWWTGHHCNSYAATYQLYWCAARKMQMPPESGFLFGGIYTKTTVNPVTGAHSCPPSFYPTEFGAGDVSVCLSRDFQLSNDYRIDFGGFFSCHSGNPYDVLPEMKQMNLTGFKANTKPSPGFATVRSSLYSSGPKKWPKHCSSGYSQHMGFIEHGCEMMFCMKGNIRPVVEAEEAKRPPFIHLHGKVPTPRKNHKMTFQEGTWEYNTKLNSWKYKERLPWEVMVGVLGTIVATICIGAAIAVIIMTRKRRQRSGEHEPLLDNTPSDEDQTNQGTVNSV